MYELLVSIVIGAFLVLLFFNIFFRIKVLKVYKKLERNRVDFTVSQLLNKSRLEEEVLHLYPKHKDDILLYGHYIRTSFRIGLLCLVIIIIGGIILYIYR
jgi:hypothetical protein